MNRNYDLLICGAAADANAITLSEYGVMSNQPFIKKIISSLIINGMVLADIPLVTDKTMVQNGSRWMDNLPTVNWAKLNEGTTVTKGKPTPYSENAWLMRNAIDADNKIIEDRNQIVDPRAAQLDAYLKAVSYDFNDKYINNDHLSGDEDSFIGLRYRLDNPSTFRLASECKIDAGGVDLSPSGMTSQTANAFVEYLDQLLSFLGREEGDGVFLYMNDTLKRRMARAIRVLGTGAGFNIVTDAYDRTISKYKNATVVNIGRKADQSTRIITNTETSTGAAGASTFTSIYAAVYGEEALMGWQFDSIDNSCKDVGLIGNDSTISRLSFDYAVGLLPNHSRCLGRLYDIKMS
jgi:hypothetical protein